MCHAQKKRAFALLSLFVVFCFYVTKDNGPEKIQACRKVPTPMIVVRGSRKPDDGIEGTNNCSPNDNPLEHLKPPVSITAYTIYIQTTSATKLNGTHTYVVLIIRFTVHIFAVLAWCVSGLPRWHKKRRAEALQVRI